MAKLHPEATARPEWERDLRTLTEYAIMRLLKAAGISASSIPEVSGMVEDGMEAK